MNVPFARRLALVLPLVCALLFCGSMASAAQQHVVSPSQLRNAITASAQTRQNRISNVQQFFSSPRVEKALKSANIDPVQVRRAVPQLSDQELARLSNETQKIQRDFAAGTLNNQQITYILIALGTALLVTIIFIS